jgi:SlyX protein
MSSSMDSELTTRLDDLESRLAFQDDLIESLNEVITRQDRDLARLVLQVNAMATKLSDMSDAGAGSSSSEGFEIPPHY